MDFVAVIAIDILESIATLVLISIGLAIIFGMMKIINIAHGEFLMLGGYTVVLANKAGVNSWVAILVLAPLVVAAFGVIIERFFLRFLYGRMVDTLLATWGLSMLMMGAVTVVFGNTQEGVEVPLGSFSVGQYRVSAYSIVLIAAALLALVAVYSVLRWTRLGLVARGTMQNPAMAAALGISPSFVYMLTFAIGAALSGLAGGLLAPTTGVVPSMGAAFIGQAFITVVTGGVAIVGGTGAAAALLGTISQITTFLTTPVMGDVMLLFAAVVLLRLMPQGIAGRWLRSSL